MPKLKIRTYGDEILRKKAKIIKRFDKELEQLVHQMFDMMYEAKGVGLAAPQVGISRRLIVLDTTDPGEKFALANPKIVWKSEDTDINEEGCLSIPGVEGDVARSIKIKVKANDIHTGEDITIDASDFLARVLQHEIDHLDGVLFVDHLRGKEKAQIRRTLEEMAITT